MDYIPGKRTRSKTGKPFLAGNIPFIHERDIYCPYCGESFAVVIDTSAGNQSYYEDCEICCRPIMFRVEVDSEGDVAGLTVLREDD